MPSITPDDTSLGPAEEELLDVLRAVLEAVGIPHAATVGDQEVCDAILVEGAGHAVAMLDGILGEDPFPNVPWSVAYPRARLADHPPAGHKTWEARGRAGGHPPGGPGGGWKASQRRRERLRKNIQPHKPGRGQSHAETG